MFDKMLKYRVYGTKNVDKQVLTRDRFLRQMRKDKYFMVDSLKIRKFFIYQMDKVAEKSGNNRPSILKQNNSLTNSRSIENDFNPSNDIHVRKISDDFF